MFIACLHIVTQIDKNDQDTIELSVDVVDSAQNIHKHEGTIYNS